MSIQVIDPGHGGKDPGAVANGSQEKGLVLDISHRICRHLEAKYETDAKMTRLTDRYVSLQARCDFANNHNAGSFLSVHINAGGGTGFESYVVEGAYPHSAGLLQKNVHECMAPVLKKHGLPDRGKKYDTQSNPGRIHVLRETKMKACLVEILFIDTDKDAKLLKSSSFRDEVASVLADAIAKTEGLKEKKQEEPKDDSGSSSGDDWIRVQMNGEQKHAFKEPDNAVNWVKNTIKSGDTLNIKR